MTGNIDMLCYAMLCYAMLCYAMLCYAMEQRGVPLVHPVSPNDTSNLLWPCRKSRCFVLTHGETSVLWCFTVQLCCGLCATGRWPQAEELDAECRPAPARAESGGLCDGTLRVQDGQAPHQPQGTGIAIYFPIMHCCQQLCLDFVVVLHQTCVSP